jgi:protein involved in polysaccharide export with SLBB domain
MLTAVDASRVYHDLRGDLESAHIRRDAEEPFRLQRRVADALTPAGGLLESADDREIILFRGRERRKFNYRDYELCKRPEENIPLENGEVIVVP